MDEEQYDLKKNINTKLTMVSGTCWRGSAEAFRIAWTALVVLILASILDPIAFGLIGMTDALVQFFNVFMTMGFDSAVIQQEKVNNRILSSLFWLNLMLGVVLAGVGTAVSPLLSWFYQDNRVGPIFVALSMTFILQSFAVIQRGLLAREMAFRSLAIVDILATIISSLLAIFVAVRGGSYWSLVVLQLGKHAILSLGYWLTSPWRPQPLFDLRATMPSVQFSGNILFYNLLNFAATHSDIILVGRLLGPEQAGFYLLANRLIMTPVGQVLNVIMQTLYPILSAIQNEITKVRETYVKVILATFSGLAPAILVAGLVGTLLIPYYLGEQWGALVPIFLVWCFGALQRIVMSRLSILYLSMGRPDLQWKYQLVSTPIVILALVIGVQQGAFGASVSYNLAQFFTSFLSIYLAFSLIDLGMGTYFKRFRYSVAALLVAAAVGVGLLYGFEQVAWHPLLVSGLIGLVVLAVYVLALYLLDPFARQLWADVRSWLPKRSV
ncbi:lipopolysaccharide biosynthesis protein [Candidatus Leptofilum sp.]|uniref:lipopolysaccharide biosynthesis protein n=1 Tax=Candidatus Leptofilum sp. TaxID=3241576 RepID=UPI003B5AE5B8